jgi:cytochrome P450
MTLPRPDGPGPLPEFLQHRAGDVVPVVTPAGDPMLLVRDYALGRGVLTDARFSRAEAVRPHAPKFIDAEPVPASMMSIDGTEHARLRRIIAGTFTSGRVAALAPYVEKLVDGHLDELEAAGPGADVMELLAEPLPLTVMCTLMGVPLADSREFSSWVTVLFDISASTPQDKVRHRVRLARYMTELVARKRREPGDDLLTALIRRHDGGELSMTELVTMGLALLMAGYETTIGQIGLSVLSLLSDPAMRAAFLAEPDATVEELLRLNPTTPASFPRVATETVRLGDTTVRAGEGVLVSLLDANRDEQALGRPHLTFGHGPHRCPGAPLARLQVRAAVERLLRRFPALRLADVPEPVVWKEGLVTRGLTRLAVQW